MSWGLSVILWTVGGVILGASVGWVVGRRLKLHGIGWLVGVGACFLIFSYLAVQAAIGGDRLLADAWLGAAFGSMTSVKYAAGLLPGTGDPAEGSRNEGHLPAEDVAQLAEDESGTRP